VIGEEHVPVLVEEVLDVLAPISGGFYVDGTFGRGGHVERLSQAVGPTRPCARARSRSRCGRGRPHALRAGVAPANRTRAGFAATLAAVVRDCGGERAVAGVLLDLGVSSPQLDVAERGFSFQKDGPLDMRMDPTRGESAAEFVAEADGERELRTVIAELGEERRRAHRTRHRRRAPTSRSHALRNSPSTVRRAVRTHDGKHPATRTFQALRMYVNDELGQLRAGLKAAFDVLAPGGRLAVISFHSLEDRMVKRFIRSKTSVDPVFAGLPVIPPSARPTMREVASARECRGDRT
jgi:16S rRNA (cytosine1402-N4)-methyltransferase